MHGYLDLARDVIENGTVRKDRTGVGTIGVFSRQLRFNLDDGLPLLTTKKLHVPSIIHELLWFISGDTNIEYLRKNGVSIWNEWADQDGELGPVYGNQWRKWKSSDGRVIDQLKKIIDEIRLNPNSRRLLISAWNVAEIEKMALPPCHYSFQFYVSRGRLSCLFNMRSTDVFLGLPFNIASYALLTHLIAQQTNLNVGELIWAGGDIHIYTNHLDQVDELLSRQPGKLPTLLLNRVPDTIFDYRFDDFIIKDYVAQPHISAPIAV